MITIEKGIDGALKATALVSCGPCNAWFETQRYYGYKAGEAQRLFKKHCKDMGYTIEE